MKRRNTESTNEIYNILKDSKSALSQDMIQERISANIDRATIYRILNRFYEDKLVHKIVGDNGKQYFSFCVTCEGKKQKQNHFYFRCTECGKMECLEIDVEISLPKGYKPKDFNGVISGICADCAKKE